MELRAGAATDVGQVRAVNEDALLSAAPVFAVADGMGGHAAGDVASRIVIEELGRLADREYDAASAQEAVRQALVAAQDRLLAFARGQGASGSGAWYAGTTVVAAVLSAREAEPGWVVANLGDSRCYRLPVPGSALERVTVDHSLVQELIDAGRITEEMAAIHPERHVITRALGGSDAVDPDLFWLPLAETGRLLLCTDGVTGMVSEGDLADLVGGADSPQDAADAVVAAAVRAGGIDNATAVVVDVVGWAP